MRWNDMLAHVRNGGHTRALAHVSEGAHAIRQGGESLIAGGLLAVAHAEKGLDMGAKKHIPADFVAGLALLAGATALAGRPDGISTDVRNIASTCLGVFAFRKGFDLMHEKKAQSGELPAGTVGAKALPAAVAHGDIDSAIQASGMGEDPIIAAARAL